MGDVANYCGHLALQFGAQPRCKSFLQRIVLVTAPSPARLSPAVENGIGTHSDRLDRAFSGMPTLKIRVLGRREGKIDNWQ